MTAQSRGSARPSHAQSAGPRTTLTVIATSAAAGAVAGWGAYYAVDRFRMPWGATIREHRRAGWNSKRRAAA